MTGMILERRLSAVSRRIHRLRILRRQTTCWLVVMVPAVMLCLLLPVTGLPLRRETLSLLSAVIAGLVLARWRQAVPTWVETARLVEQHDPGLKDIVLTALRYQPRDSSISPVLASRVLRQADNFALVADWESVVSRKKIFVWFTASLLTFGALVSSVIAAGRLLQFSLYEIPPMAQDSALNDAAMNVTVEPGDVEIERGSGLTIVARFTGQLPSRAVVRFTPGEVPAEILTEKNTSSSAVSTHSMSLTVDAGVFMVRLPAVTQDGSYVVLRGDDHASSPGLRTASGTYRITTYVRPRVIQVDAGIVPPDWTNRRPSTIKDTRRIVAIEGSTVTMDLHVNKPVTISHLKSDHETELPLTGVSADGMTLQTTLTADVDTTWTVFLQDRQGRSAGEETEIMLRIIKNEPPTIRITFPQSDISVSALQEVVTEAEVTDDFGIVDFGICWSLGAGEPQSISLAEENQMFSGVEMSHTMDLEALGAEPSDLLSWHFYADTYVADGRIQRSLSDLMFAEVRRFEGIFRESQQQEGLAQQAQNAGPTGDLLQIQRQIAIALWNVQRSLTDTVSSTDAETTEDVTTIRESQMAARARLQAIKESANVNTEVSDAVQSADDHMSDVIDALTDWSLQAPEPALTDASAAAQAAFRSLLRLRIAEHTVRRSQSGQGVGSGQQDSTMQQQLDQLELDNNRNRYESEQQAQQNPQTEAQQEQLQVLNRLKDLAHRQNMVNERLKQLQSELRNARDDQERETIRRKLKRLRDEQQELLRDVDDLTERIDQSSSRNSPQQRQLREQVGQARENVREASRAMDDGKLSEALSKGTRAERRFDQLEENFRSQTSSAFTEAARDLRQRARELSERQQEIANQLRGGNSDDESAESRSGPPSLRTQQRDDEIRRKLEQQRNDLRRIVEDSKEVVEQSESSEPLLARRLYEAVNQVENSKTEEALRAGELLAERGLWPQATEAEQVARRGIEELQEGIAQAAEAVLGSEAVALRRAKDTLEQLSSELSDELSEAVGRRPAADADQPQLDREQASRHGTRHQETPQQEDPKQDNTRQPYQRSPSPSESAGNSGGEQESETQSEQSDYSALHGGGREPGDSSSQFSRPLTGSDFRNWSDRLREVEELLDDPNLRQRVAQVRDRARSMRAEFRRHGTEPQWDLVQSDLMAEIQSVRRRLVQDIAALKSGHSLVPIDRESVPEEFDELVQRYYELLGLDRIEAAP